jgi:UDP-N-acetylglucosamine acyltransferase
MTDIHSTAVVAPEAEIGDGCSVGPYSVIGPKVKLGNGCRVGSHVVIEGNTTIGDENQIFQFASVGAAPQDLKYHGEDSTLQIGSRNIIREYVTLQPGTEGGGMQTTIGDQNLFMACCHVGHDCRVGHRNVFANSAALAGHVTIGNGVIVGGLSGVHQFVT